MRAGAYLKSVLPAFLRHDASYASRAPDEGHGKPNRSRNATGHTCRGFAPQAFAPADLKLAATSPALTKTFFISFEVMPIVVFRSVTPPPAAATMDAAAATSSDGPSETTRKSY